MGRWISGLCTFFHLGRRINSLVSILKAGMRLFGLIGTSVCRISSRQCGNKVAAAQLSPLADNLLHQWLTYQCSVLHARLGRRSLLSGGGPSGLSGFSCAVCSWLLRHLAFDTVSKGWCFSVSSGSAKPTHLCHFKQTLQTSFKKHNCFQPYSLHSCVFPFSESYF